MTEEALKICVEADCELDISDVTLRFANEILTLEPFGVGNPSPIFMMRDMNVKRITPIGGGKHTRLLLEKDGVCVTGLYFGVGESELGFETGDLIDVLFHLDINDYKNTRTVQLVLQDARVAEVFTAALDAQKKRYAEINEGGTFDSSEDVLPSREDFACVYKVLRREYRYGTSVLDQKSILKLIHSGGAYQGINYIKLKYILRVFSELNICEIVELDNDIYQFHVVYNATKTNIEKSSILKKLRSQCADRSR